MVNQYPEDSFEFSSNLSSEIATVEQHILKLASERVATRGLTIDGPTTRELDDALWLERDSYNGYKLFVSIADVASLITREMTPQIDESAFTQSFTHYYPTSNSPMLPTVLSEDCLSLHEGQQRLTITVTIPLDTHLRPGTPIIQPTCLVNSKRFTYEEVDAEIKRPTSPFAPMLQELFYVAQGLLQRRRANGALAIYDILTGWATTEEGFLIQLSENQRNKAHIIIQECMILTNQVLAGFLAERSIPILYRNHSATKIAPERSQLLDWIDMVVTPRPDLSTPEQIRTTIGFALERAKYAPKVTGHFGLQLPAYTHLTSPLRRYADLVNQRILLAVTHNEPLPYTMEELEDIAAHINSIESQIKGAKKDYFRSEYDKEIQEFVEQAKQTQAERPLEGLDSKRFHSLLRIRAEMHTLDEVVKKEFLLRIEEGKLQARDVFTLVFRFKNDGEEWEPIKVAVQHWLADQPHQSISILTMGKQSQRWTEPIYEERQNEYGCFQARGSASVGEQIYISSFQSATQKERAKQLAGAELLVQIMGKQSTIADLSRQEPHRIEVPVSHTVLIEQNTFQNYKGQLLELAQVEGWDTPTFVETKREGPVHTPVFTIEASIVIDGTNHSAPGIGKSRSQSEQMAAHNLLQIIPQFPAKLSTSITDNDLLNPVGSLNEFKQKGLISDVEYIYDATGLPHTKTFTCYCTVMNSNNGDIITGEANGKTKKEAAKLAAFQALQKLLTGSDSQLSEQDEQGEQ